MTDLPETSTAPATTAPKSTTTQPGSPDQSPWDRLLDQLRQRYPGQKESILFCIWKLQQNPELTLRDFRDEARLHGLNLAGRSLHSARVLLGLAEPSPSPRRKEVARIEAATSHDEPARAPTKARNDRKGRSHGGDSDSIEGQLLAAVQNLQSAANADTQRLRTAIRAAIDILSQALDQD